jgi:hypothetical protein
LVCLEDEITLGQAVPGTPVEVPIVGDLSRRHATLQRRGENYLIVPFHNVRVEGQRIEDPTVLADGDEIELGATVVMRFRQPHALSVTGRLELLSHHRTRPSADGILLMADSCILGPSQYNHVICRNWGGDLVLFRRNNRLHCRAQQTIEIDGKMRGNGGEVHWNSRISGNDFCVSLEPLE